MLRLKRGKRGVWFSLLNDFKYYLFATIIIIIMFIIYSKERKTAVTHTHTHTTQK